MSAQSVREQFLSRFGYEPEVIAVAPGRVNLIGEHTDYSDGFVFPAAIDRGLWVAASPTSGPSTIYSEQRGDGSPFESLTVEPGKVDGWASYVAGMAWALRPYGAKSNIHAVVDSTIPIGSGVSSSAAVEMAFGVVWRALDGLKLSNQDLAKIGQVCENQFVGVNSGIMDQMASAMGRDGFAMFLDTRSLEIEYAPIPTGLIVVLCDTQTPRSLAGSAYNERRSQTEAAAKAMNIAALRDGTMEALEAVRDEVGDDVYRRAKHVITEDDRCLDFKAALAKGDLMEVGELMKGSHISLRDDFEVSCRELDAMAESAWDAPGCVGARMTGAGFGGACVALVREELASEFESATLAGFEKAIGRPGSTLRCGVAEGARVVV